MSVRLRLVMGAALVSSCGSPGGVAQPMTSSVHDCPAVACLNGASYLGDIPLDGVDLAQPEVRACFNVSCVRCTLTSQNRRLYECSSEELSLYCGLHVSADNQSGRLFVRLGPPRGGDPLVTLQEGDIYDVTIRAPARLPFVRLHGTAGYRLNYASHPECGRPCKSLGLSVTK